MTDLTYCRICEASCGLRVQRDAEGAVAKLLPDKQHPTSAGYVCAKGLRFPSVSDHPDRLTEPVVDGAPVSWTAALEAVRARVRPIIEEHGPHAVAIYGGNPLAFNGIGTLAFFWLARALGTRNVYVAGSQDCHNKFAASRLMHGSPYLHPLIDVEHADLAVFLGTNPALSQGSFVHLAQGVRGIDRLIERGGATVFVDPRRTESVKRWGGHVPIRPGTDAALLLAVLRLLGPGAAKDDPRYEGLDRLLAVAEPWTPARAEAATGIAAADIEALAAQIGAADRATFHLSVGVNQGPFGTLAYLVMQAIAAVTGNYDREGGLLFHPSAMRMARVGRRLRLGTREHYSRVGGFRSVTDCLPGGILADEITTPGPERVRAVISVAGDPLRSIPGTPRLEAAFAQLDCLVAVDIFPSATARAADIVLPATTWLERGDMAMTTAILQHAPLLQYTRAVAEPRGEARNEAAILTDLSLALKRPLLGWLTRPARVFPWGRLFGGLAWLNAKLRGQGEYGVRVPTPKAGRYLGRGPLTPGRRVRFWHPELDGEPARLDAFAEQVSGRWTLIGRRRRIGHNGWIHGGTRAGRCESAAYFAPADLEALGVVAGDRVTIRSEGGEVTLKAAVDEGLGAGIVAVPHGLPEGNVNAALPSGPDRVERLSGQHWMTGIPVDVEPAAAGALTDQSG